MKAVENIYDEYRHAVSEKRKLSNCYFSSNQLLNWIDSGNVIAYSDSKSLIISVQEVGYRKLYFLAETWECFEKISEIDIGKGEMAFEIISQGELGEYDLSKKIQCKKVIDYIRLRATGRRETKIDLKKIDYCSKEDISRLIVLINSTFDPVGAYLPTNEELLFLIENKAIICHRNTDGEVMGFLIFEDKGKTTYIRMLCIAENSRGKGLGTDLLLSYLNLHKDFKNFTLWCRADNTIAFKLYTQIGGYNCENFHNYVFVL